MSHPAASPAWQAGAQTPRSSQPAPAPLRTYLPPGRLFASGDAVHVTTILGSCVAVCLWDPEARVGGMNHFLLPEGSSPSPRFGRDAVPLLVEAVLALGASRARLRAKLFGGACVLEAFRAGSRHLGARNVDVARERLRAEQVAVVAEDVGGDLGRKLVFDVQGGCAWVRTIETDG